MKPEGLSQEELDLRCRCHRCILAARSDYFRAFLERSPAQPPSPTSAASLFSQSPHLNCTAYGLPEPPFDPPPHANPASLATSLRHDTEPAGVPAANQHSTCTQQHSVQKDPKHYPSSDADTSRAVNMSQQQHSPAAHSTDGSDRQLSRLTVSDVSLEVFQLVLEFAYSGSLQVLPPCWLKAAGAELLFEAAERYLMPLLKVMGPAALYLTTLIQPWS